MNETFSSRLQQCLSAAPRGTASRLARAVGVRSSYISALANGTKANPSLEVTQQLARNLNVRAQWLLSGELPRELNSGIENSSREQSCSPWALHEDGKNVTSDTLEDGPLTADLERYILLLKAALAYHKHSPPDRRPAILRTAQDDLNDLFLANSQKP